MSDDGVYVYETARSGRARAKRGGSLAEVPPLELGSAVLLGLLNRSGVDKDTIEDVVLGVATQTGEQGGNLARAVALHADLKQAPGATVNRFCASGLEAIAAVAGQIALGSVSGAIAGGVESISRVPMYSDQAPWFVDPELRERAGTIEMGIAADLIATLEGFEREELDSFGLRTQQRASAAWNAGRWGGDVVPVTVPGGVTFAIDEAIRADTSLAGLAALAPAFAQLGAAGQDRLAIERVGGLKEITHLHTVGTSPTLVDAAAVALLGNREAGQRWSLRPRARIVSAQSAAVDPIVMLTSSQLATTRILERAGLAAADVTVFEVAEAFAAVCLKFERDLGLSAGQLNPNGGTIAAGHAFGATGVILLGNCVAELERTGGRYGIVAVSGAAGVGSALLIERIAD